MLNVKVVLNPLITNRPLQGTTDRQSLLNAAMTCFNDLTDIPLYPLDKTFVPMLITFLFVGGIKVRQRLKSVKELNSLANLQLFFNNNF